MAYGYRGLEFFKLRIMGRMNLKKALEAGSRWSVRSSFG
jgi:hypothetical protein